MLTSCLKRSKIESVRAHLLKYSRGINREILLLSLFTRKSMKYFKSVPSLFLVLLSIISLLMPSLSVPRGKRKSSVIINSKLNSQLEAYAVQHHKKMLTTGGCSGPKPYVLPISSLVPHSLSSVKTFDPPASILHRCNSHSGCCFDEKFTCQPKTMETVDLYFFAINFDTQEKSVEKLSFVNHTQCECVASGVFYELA